MEIPLAEDERWALYNLFDGPTLPDRFDQEFVTPDALARLLEGGCVREVSDYFGLIRYEMTEEGRRVWRRDALFHRTGLKVLK